MPMKPTLAAFLLATLLGLPVASGGEDKPAVPLSPAEEKGTFPLADPDLFTELAAAEPEVVSPVAIAWDEDGRLFVAEMIDYPAGAAAGRIKRLEDRDNNGTYEHATVF